MLTDAEIQVPKLLCFIEGKPSRKVREMAWLEKCFPQKHESECGFPSIYTKKQERDVCLKSQYWGREDRRIPTVCWLLSPHEWQSLGSIETLF